MRVPALFSTLLLAACGGSSDDPCTIDASNPKPASASAAELGVDRPTLECSGTSGGVALQCSGTATVAGAKCTDGFALTIDSGNARVLMRFKGDVDNGWTWGAKLAGGDVLSDKGVTVAGLKDPADPIPASGSSFSTRFSFNGPNRIEINGAAVTTW